MTLRPSSFAAQLRADLPAVALKHVLGVFRDETKQLTTTLKTAARAGDLEAFRRTAHSIAGSAATVGAKDLENSARLGMSTAVVQPAQMSEMAGQIEQCSRLACEHASELIDELA